MQKSSNAADYRGLLLSFFVLVLAAALLVAPNLNRTKAGNAGEGLVQRTSSHVPGLENYDIREDKAAFETLTRFRQDAGKDAAMIADIRQQFVRGEEELRRRVPTLKVEYNRDIRTPEVITPDVWKADIERLTPPSNKDRAEILRDFVKENNSLVGVSDSQADQLKVTANYTNPNGYMSFAHLEQQIDGIPVFRGEIKAGFTKDGRMIRAINNLAPGLDYESLSRDFHNPVDAVKAAFRHINAEPTKIDLEINQAASNDLKVVFGSGDGATTAEKMYFPTEPGVARPAWRVLIWQPVNAFYVIVDAETGAMLWRKNITEDQTQAATYEVYANPNAFINVADNPAPLTPGPIDPGLGTQGVNIARTQVTLIGNEPPNWGQNNLGWITDGMNVTDGNNVEAGIDRVSPNGVDAPMPGDTGCPGAGCRVFTSPTWNPPPGNPAPGDAPLTPQAQRGAVIQMFYVMNMYHDVLYSLGFTEQALNFQHDNFGRGGAGNDRISAEGQDSSGTDNANFATPADGGRGRMQMFLWTGPTPDYDGTADAEVIIHEVTHGTSNRLHGNASGLSNNMSRGMGEGWGDWYGHTLLAEPTDPINGIYTTGGYVTYQIAAGFTGNYYYGIRRFPKAVMSFTGGPNNRPHNPLTFADLNAGCDLSDGAFPRGPVGVAQCDQVHNAGEIWSSALWEVRSLMVTRLGFTEGTRRALQVVTDGMKLAPLGPTFLQERDAIIAAASALPSAPMAAADVDDVREGFRIRGMGFSASVQSVSPAVVTEAFDLPNVQVTNPFSVDDSTGNNNGVPEPGENVLLNVAVINTTGATVNNVVANVNGGPNVSYGNIPDGQTVTRQIPFTIPADAECGSTITVTINVSSDIGAQAPAERSFYLGSPVGIVENFDGVTAPSLPAGWTMTQDVGSDITWTTTTNGPNSTPNSAFAPDPGAINMSSLVSPVVSVTSSSAQLKFKNKYATESTFDGMVLEIKIGNADFQDIEVAGGSFVSGGYNSTISTNWQSPIGGRRAWSGNSPGNTYVDTVVNLPESANGNSVQFRWRMASDVSVSATGVNIDDVEIVSSFTCQPVTPSATKSRADFDGDGRTDLSVFRGSEGNWYLQRSTDGFAAINWGISSDVLVPGDFDGDGKTDTAVFRASDTSGVADFYILNSSGFTFAGYEWGSTGDVPVVGDYDGDDKTDVAVYRPSTGDWYVINSSGSPANTIVNTGGQGGDVPVVGDFDGDGKADFTIYRSGVWMGTLSGGGSMNVSLGSAGDILVPADYDGDDKDDVAVFRPSTGEWIYIASNGGATVTTEWGASGDIPVPGDYDGDGTDDFAVYRNGQWWLNQSTNGQSVTSFGLGSDSPIPSAYLP